MYTGTDYNVKGIDGEIGITAPNAGNYKYKEICFACTGLVCSHTKVTAQNYYNITS